MATDRPEIEPKRNFRLVPPGRKSDAPAQRWQISLHTPARKIIAIAIILATSGALIYHTWFLFLAAWITRDKPMNPEIFERAIRYDPKNADYHFILGQIYNYSTQDLNLDRAREEFEAAVQLNPYRAIHWLELSKFYEQAGNVDRARLAMTKVLETDPNYAQRHWAAANLYVRLGDQKAADYELRRAADLDPGYTIQVLDLVWSVYEDPDLVMSTHVPNTKESNLTALNYFIARKSDRGAELAWERLKTFSTRPQERFGYVEYLINEGKTQDAWTVFASNLPELDPGIPPFYNAGFETEPLNGGFDWRFATSDDAEVRRDTTTVKDGMASLYIGFSGKQNVNYGEVWHYLPVTKGKSYIVKFWMKTDSITTNEGIYVNVDGQSSEKQVGTTYWQEIKIPFTATSDLVRVTVRRDPSKKFDNLLAGKVWLDGFVVTTVQ